MALPSEITMGTRHELGMSWVLPMLPRLGHEHPELTIHLYFGSGADLLIRVRTLEVDCAIGSMRLTDPKLDSVRLHREDYVLVGQAKMLHDNPFRRAADAAKHTLIDTHPELPLFSYWRDAPAGSETLEFRRVLMMGTIAAIRALVLQGGGVAVLPSYLVAADLRAKRLVRLLPRTELASDYFRLIFRADDPRRGLYAALGQSMLSVPLR
jgi:DNA-binding transcriptional LysR family regulator